MEITNRGLWTLIHGMGFGTLYLLACSGALVELWRHYAPGADALGSARDTRFLRVYLLSMAMLAWITVITGAYLIYPWYRAVPPAGTTNLAGFPQQLLMASPTTFAWHSIGMEWKEHVAWMVPIAITMAAAVFARYGGSLRNQPALRKAVLGFTALSFLAASIAGFWGAMLAKDAPVSGGPTIHLIESGGR